MLSDVVMPDGRTLRPELLPRGAWAVANTACAALSAVLMREVAEVVASPDSTASEEAVIDCLQGLAAGLFAGYGQTKVIEDCVCRLRGRGGDMIPSTPVWPSRSCGMQWWKSRCCHCTSGRMWTPHPLRTPEPAADDSAVLDPRQGHLANPDCPDQPGPVSRVCFGQTLP